MSYAAVTASGRHQTPQEAAAPQLPEVEPSEVVSSTASLVDVDTPSVHTVSSDFREQPVKTETQAARKKRESDAAARMEARIHQAEEDLAAALSSSGPRRRPSIRRSASRADGAISSWLADLSDGTLGALATSNVAAAVATASWLGYKAWGRRQAGTLNWEAVGYGVGILGAVGVVYGVVGGYLYRAKNKKQDGA